MYSPPPKTNTHQHAHANTHTRMTGSTLRPHTHTQTQADTLRQPATQRHTHSLSTPMHTSGTHPAHAHTQDRRHHLYCPIPIHLTCTHHTKVAALAYPFLCDALPAGRRHTHRTDARVLRVPAATSHQPKSAERPCPRWGDSNSARNRTTAKTPAVHRQRER